MRYVILISLFVFLLFLQACLSDSVEAIENSTNCDTTQMRYEVNIKPIINTHCLSCHQTGIAEAGVVLYSYESLKSFALNGALIGTIEHQEGFPPMPLNAAQLQACEINKIKAWINQGVIE